MQPTKFIFTLVLSVAVIWGVTLVIFWPNWSLLGTGLIAFCLGLRHGLDADHIVAIDNITRQLAADNKPSITTGLFFALGHSTIVFLLTLLIVAGVINFKGNCGRWGDYAALTGTLVSAGFLWLTAMLNLKVLIELVANKNHHHHHLPRGLLAWLGRRLFKLVDRPAKMYLVGFFFGLGFDTATEVALLGLAASATLSGLTIWSILLLPLLFAAGMVITDSLDSLWMSKVYRWASQGGSQRLRNYNLLIIGIATGAAFLIGGLELIGLMSEHWSWFGRLSLLSNWFDDNSALVGLSLFALLIYLWCYGRWRQQVTQ